MYCSSSKLPDWPSWLSLRKEISMTWEQSALKAVACWQLYTWGLAPSCLCYAIAFPRSSLSLPWAQVQAEPCWLSGKYSRGKVDYCDLGASCAGTGFGRMRCSIQSAVSPKGLSIWLHAMQKEPERSFSFTHLFNFWSMLGHWFWSNTSGSFSDYLELFFRGCIYYIRFLTAVFSILLMS